MATCFSDEVFQELAYKACHTKHIITGTNFDKYCILSRIKNKYKDCVSRDFREPSKIVRLKCSEAKFVGN